MPARLCITALLFIIVNLSCKTKKTHDVGKNEKETKIQTFKVDDNSFMMKMQREGLKEAFSGVTTSQGKVKKLFPIRSTSVSTEPIVRAANDFIKSLTNDQSEKTLFDLESDEWRKWSNVDNGIFGRAGISLQEMNASQKQLAFKLLQSSLSKKGLQLSKDIMKTDQTLKEMNNNAAYLDEELYFFTIMGEPSSVEPWGWQLDGHHLVINYFVMGDQVVMTPTFMGGEPIMTTSGKYDGNTIFQDEQNLGLQLVKSLSSDQQALAIISDSKAGHNAQTEAFRDNVVLDYEGIRVNQLSESNRQLLLSIIDQYVSNMDQGHADIKMEEVNEHLSNTYFAWIGKTNEDAVFYYRIHSPVILIEFDHQSAVGAPSDEKGATKNHIHTVVRTPNGNDYGKDLLRQHLEEHHH